MSYALVLQSSSMKWKASSLLIMLAFEKSGDGSHKSVNLNKVSGENRCAALWPVNRSTKSMLIVFVT